MKYDTSGELAFAAQLAKTLIRYAAVADFVGSILGLRPCAFLGVGICTKESTLTLDLFPPSYAQVVQDHKSSKDMVQCLKLPPTRMLFSISFNTVIYTAPFSKDVRSSTGDASSLVNPSSFLSSFNRACTYLTVQITSKPTKGNGPAHPTAYAAASGRI